MILPPASTKIAPFSVMIPLIFFAATTGVEAKPISQTPVKPNWPTIKYYLLLSFGVTIVMNLAFIIYFLVKSEIWKTLLKEKAKKFLNNYSYAPFLFMAQMSLFSWKNTVSPLEILTFVSAAFVLNNLIKQQFD